MHLDVGIMQHAVQRAALGFAIAFEHCREQIAAPIVFQQPERLRGGERHAGARIIEQLRDHRH
ncbi:MAG TPA: hypothetical protein DEQ47_14700 [Solibacterales bacterium]|nr:hypothetical protein [Bryobacterales bacterium]